MNNKKIGEFTIERYNQYELKEGSKLSTCPKCSEDRKPANQKQKCLMLDWDRGLGTCQHCGDILQLHTYKKEGSEIKTYTRPKYTNVSNLSDKVLKFFEGRGIGLRSLNIAKVSEGLEWMPQFKKEVNTIQFNYIVNNECINIKYRGAKKSFKLAKDAELILSGVDRWRHDESVIIVEGEIDELSFIEAGLLNVASVPNGGAANNLLYIDNSYEYLEHKERIILCVDQDETGQKLQAELIRRLGAERCYLVDLGIYKDANEALMVEGVHFLQAAILNAKACPLENVLTFNDIESDYENFINNGLAKGFVMGIEKFDEVFSVYKKQVCAFTGIPGGGKSDWVDMMVIGYAILYGWKTAYISIENTPTFVHADKIIRKIMGRKVTNADLKTRQYQVIKEFVNDHFFFYNYPQGYDLTTCLKKGDELVKRKGIECLVIDPYNKIKLKESLNKNVNDYTNDYLLELDKWANKNDCLVGIVAHPTKMQKDQTTKEWQEPNFYSIKGGGEWFDMCHHGILVHRLFSLNVVKIHVMKCKFQHLGINGSEVFMMWNAASGRYQAAEGSEEEGFTCDWNNQPWLKVDEEPQQEEPKIEQVLELTSNIEQTNGKTYKGYDEECGF